MVAELKHIEEAIEGIKRELAQVQTSFAVYGSGLNEQKLKLTDDINREFAKVNLSLMEVVFVPTFHLATRILRLPTIADLLWIALQLIFHFFALK